MSTTPLYSSLLPAKPDRFHSGTPRQDHIIGCDTPGSTLSDRGSSAPEEQEDDTDRINRCKREDYDYTDDDLNSRVLVNFEVFLRSVLHVPCDWKILWGPAIEAIKVDQEFRTHHREYCRRREEHGSSGQSFSDALRKTANAVIDVVSTSKFYGTSGNPIHQANNFCILEGKPYRGAICNGKCMPRLIVDGVDPILNHATPYNPIQPQSGEFASPTSSATSSGSALRRKRCYEESLASSQRSSKKPRTNPVMIRLDEEDQTLFRDVEESEHSSASTTGTKTQSGAGVQVCSYLLEMFSNPLLRSHATVCLVDRDCLQLYHANRSVILVSSVIDLFKGDGLDHFIVVIIAFHRLSLKEYGTLDAFQMDDLKLVKDPKDSSNNQVVQNQNQLELTEDGSDKKFTVTLGDIISHDPAIVGRSTLVRRARSDQWPNVNLVVKISWPKVGFGAESEFLEKAIEEAKKTEGGWATKHLPQMFWAKDIAFDEDSTLESVGNLFKDAKFEGGGYTYERRILRIIIQEELYPLKSLTNVRDIGQVFVDIACIHRWLHDHPGILHCDLSLSNTMCRIIEGLNAKGQQKRRVFGVLTDYDLSSWTKDLKNNRTKTPQQCTGTPPYMAKELLEGTSVTHLYRHDLESLFYIMLLTCARHTVDYAQDKSTKEPLQTVMQGGQPPYQRWFDEQNYVVLGELKTALFSSKAPFQLPQHFAEFRWWLGSIKSLFGKGFRADVAHYEAVEAQQYLRCSADEIDSFDDETLGGYVTYPSFIELARGLKGKLEGLVIRYDPETVPLTPAD